MSNPFFRYFLFLIAVLLCYSCAVKVAPEGGKRDTTPPKIVKSVPENFTGNFRSRKAEIEFDEYFTLKDLPAQLVVSPIISPEPLIEIKNKSLHIRLGDSLSDNTTYTINFGNSISDVNENNVLEDFRYVFSTGTYLDSMSLYGTVLNALTHSPEKSILVMLYKNNSDSVPMKSKPYYFAKTDVSGKFHISNMALGNYKVFALNDVNANYLYDLPNESIAYSEQPVPVDSSKRDISLFLFREVPPKQQLLKAYSEHFGKVTIAYKKPLEDFSISGSGNQKIPFLDYTQYSLMRDTVTFWISQPLSDTMKWILNAGILSDTVFIPMNAKKDSIAKRGKRLFKLYVSNNSSGLNLGDDLEYYFSNPVQVLDTSKIIFEADSMALNDFRIVFTDSFHLKSRVEFTLKEKTFYRIKFLPGAVKDIFGLTNDTLVSEFKTKEAKDYGTLSLRMSFPETSAQYIIHLTDEKDNLIRQDILYASAQLFYRFLPPGKYKLKVIFDNNRNERWDTGNYLLKIQPEKILFNPETITVRENFDIETEWKIP